MIGGENYDLHLTSDFLDAISNVELFSFCVEPEAEKSLQVVHEGMKSVGRLIHGSAPSKGQTYTPCRCTGPDLPDQQEDFGPRNPSRYVKGGTEGNHTLSTFFRAGEPGGKRSRSS
jgi:hypothetical protein